MTENKLYVISQEIYSEEESENFWNNFAIYINLKDALAELNELHLSRSDFKYCNFCVRTLIKKENKYIFSHETYYHQKGYS